MFPILFEIENLNLFGVELGAIGIFSRGVFLAIGFLIAVIWFLNTAQKKHMHLEFIADHFFSLLFWSLLGARLGYVYVFFGKYSDHLIGTLYLWDGGFLLWTGILFFLLALLYHCGRKKEKFGQWLDIMVPAGVIALIFETAGSFLGGNHYGTTTDAPWGMEFESVEVPYTIPIHPVQLYLLALLLILLLILQSLHRKKVRELLVGFIGICLLAFFSFLTEYFRGDEMMMIVQHRFTQIVQASIFFFSLILMFIHKRRMETTL